MLPGKLHIGLTASQVTTQRQKFGKNEITSDKQSSAFPILVSQFKSPVGGILLFAGALSALTKDWIEAAAIFAILSINAGIGFFQEFKAEHSILALRNLTAPRARVLRDGKEFTIAAVDVVLGDLLLLEAGDIVAADVKLLKSSHLQINEAILTGESLLALKEVGGASSVTAQPGVSEFAVHDVTANRRAGSAFMGTSVGIGSGQGEVISTGMSTELGKMALLMTSVV